MMEEIKSSAGVDEFLKMLKQLRIISRMDEGEFVFSSFKNMAIFDKYPKLGDNWDNIGDSINAIFPNWDVVLLMINERSRLQ